MLWTEMREPPKGLAPLALDPAPRAPERHAAPVAASAPAPKPRPTKKRRASIMADEATAS